MAVRFARGRRAARRRRSPRARDTTPASALRPAGSAFNAAVAAVAAGAEATVIGTVGDDPAGRMILAELAERGVHAEVTVADGPTGTFLLADGEIRVDRGVAHDLVLPERIEADVVLVSGYVRLRPRRRSRPPRRSGSRSTPAASPSSPPGGNVVFVSGEATEVLRPPVSPERTPARGASREAQRGRDRRRWTDASSGVRPAQDRRGRARARATSSPRRCWSRSRRGDDLADAARTRDAGRSRLARVNLALEPPLRGRAEPGRGGGRRRRDAAHVRGAPATGSRGSPGSRLEPRSAATASPPSSAAGATRCSSTGRASGSARRSSRSRRARRRPTSRTAGTTRARRSSSRSTSELEPLLGEPHPGALDAARRGREPDALHLRHDRPAEGRPALAPRRPGRRRSRRSSTRATATATGRSARCRSTTRWACTR